MWDLPSDRVRLPVYNRYSSAVLFEVGSGGIGPLGASSDFVAMLWLKDIPDDDEVLVSIPVIKSGKLKQIRQNYSMSLHPICILAQALICQIVNDQTQKTHEYEVVGWLSCIMVIDSGLDPDHEDLYVPSSLNYLLRLTVSL